MVDLTRLHGRAEGRKKERMRKRYFKWYELKLEICYGEGSEKGAILS